MIVHEQYLSCTHNVDRQMWVLSIIGIFIWYGLVGLIVMRQKSGKTTENHTPTHGKTMGVSVAKHAHVNTMSKIATCDECGIELTASDEYDIIDPDTNTVVGIEVICPNQYKQFHN